MGFLIALFWKQTSLSLIFVCCVCSVGYCRSDLPGVCLTQCVHMFSCLCISVYVCDWVTVTHLINLFVWVTVSRRWQRSGDKGWFAFLQVRLLSATKPAPSVEGPFENKISIPFCHDKILYIVMGMYGRQSRLEATVGCPAAQWITVSIGHLVHHRADLRKGSVTWRLKTRTQSWEKK